MVHDYYRGDSPDEVWYAELLLLFSFKTRGPAEPEVAWERWSTPAAKPAHAKNIRLQSFQDAKVKVTGIQAKVFQTDVVSLGFLWGSVQTPQKRKYPIACVTA